MSKTAEKKKTKPFVSAIIAAAGSSNRMNGIDKQILRIKGIPVVVRSAMAFEYNENISEIIIVCREEEIGSYLEMFSSFRKVKSIVSGGSHRQESVFRGVLAASSEAQYYAIHDGARPFVSQETIDACIQNAIEYQATTAAVKVKDTVKVVEQNCVVSTPQRDKLYLVQTPQVFDAQLYRLAMQKAQQEGKQYTDDCQLIETMQKQVAITQGDYRNTKITTQDDMYIAQFWAEMFDESRVEDENWAWL